MNRLLRFSACAILVVLAARCSSFEPEPERRSPPRPLTAAEQQIADADNRFGLKLFRAIRDGTPDENIFISPLSVSMALGMTLNGANGETRAAMEETLEHAGLSETEINASYRGLIDLLTTLDPNVTLGLANSIWYREGFSVEPSFIEANQQYFDAAVEALDFGRPGAPDVINGWVSDNTNGTIETIVQSIPGNVVMYLINALYFKGDWRTPFDEELTREAGFTRPDGTSSTVDMMTLEDATLPVHFGERLTAVDLPYGDSLYSMTVLLPREGHAVDELAADLDAARWNQITDALAPQKLSALEMPAFKLEYEKGLEEVLTDLGMGIAFAPGRADFSGIQAGGGLWIDKVKHKTFIEVDERGTEAAAVTSVIMVESLPPSIRVDRPFLFVIREQHSGTMLFIGQVTDPAA
jgi:serpin B